MATIFISWVNTNDSADKGEATLGLPITIGRSDRNSITLAGENAGVSRKHASIDRGRGRLVLTDHKSTNGTELNDKPIRQANIKHGDKFKIGTYSLELMLKVLCTKDSCNRLVDFNLATCPHCGQFLADANTQIGLS